MPELDYIEIVGRFGLSVNDGSDTGIEPDIIRPDPGSLFQLVPYRRELRLIGSTQKERLTVAVKNVWVNPDGDIVGAVSLNASGGISGYGVAKVRVENLHSEAIASRIALGKASWKLVPVDVSYTIPAERTGGEPQVIENPHEAADLVLTPGVVNDLAEVSTITDGPGVPVITSAPGRGLADDAFVQTAIDKIRPKLDDNTLGATITLPPGAPGGSDTSFKQFLGTDGTQTNAEAKKLLEQRAVSTYSPTLPNLGVRSDAFILRRSDDGDQAAQLAAFFADPNLAGKRRVIGRARVAGSVAIPDDTWIDASKAVLEVTADNVRALLPGSRTRLIGARIIGRGTDYTPSAGSSPHTKVGIHVLNAADVYIEDYVCENMAEAGIFGQNSPRGTVNGYSFLGVHGRPNGSGGTIAIPDFDARSRGMTLFDGCYDWHIEQFDTRDASMGIVTSADTPGLTMKSIRGYNIPGQHVMYIQCIENAHLSDVSGQDIAYNVLKVQLNNGHTVPNRSATIRGVTGRRITGDVLIVTNASTSVAGTPRFRGITISDISGEDIGRVAFLQSLDAAVVSNLVGRDIRREAYGIQNCFDSEFNNLVAVDTSWHALAIRGGEGGFNERIRLRGVRIRNPRALPDNPTSFIMGVYLNDPLARDVTLADVDVSDTNGVMNYGALATTTAAPSLPSTRFRDWRVRGDITNPIRFVGTPTGLGRWSGMDLAGRAVSGFPTGAEPILVDSSGQARRFVGSAVPVTGLFRTADTIDAMVAVAGQSEGWRCTTTGGAYSANWAATTAYTAGQWIRLSNGRILECTTGGTSGSTEPVVTTLNATTVDGTVVWTYRSATSAIFKARPALAA